MPPSVSCFRSRSAGVQRSARPLGDRRVGGFALVAALGLLVVLGTTGALMIRMAAVQQAGASAAILGARAEWAARSGIEWALHEATSTGDCPASTTLLTLDEGVLRGFQVAVHCTSSRHVEGVEERVSLVLRAEARFGAIGSRDFVYREVRAGMVI